MSRAVSSAWLASWIAPLRICERLLDVGGQAFDRLGGALRARRHHLDRCDALDHRLAVFDVVEQQLGFGAELGGQLRDDARKHLCGGVEVADRLGAAVDAFERPERREREREHRHQRRARRGLPRDVLHALEREVAPDDRVLAGERLDVGLHLLLLFGREEERADLERVLFEASSPRPRRSTAARRRARGRRPRSGTAAG